ncbi:MAG: BMP family protein [Bacillota bacterium]
MKKVTSIILTCLFMIACFTGCANQVNTPSQSQDNTPSQSQGENVKVAILLPGSPTDGGYNQLGAESMKGVEEKFGYETTILEVATAEAIKSESEKLAEDGYKIIIGHGAEYSTPFEEISGDYPDTFFITSGGTVVTDNQFPINVLGEQGAYVAGVVGGMLSKTKVVGLVASADFPAVTKQTRAFLLGAQSVDPAIQGVSAVLTNIDTGEAYETTMNQITGSKADIVYANAAAATLGTLKAAEEQGIYAFGGNANYIETSPKSVPFAYLVDFKAAYTSAVEACMSGTAKGILFFGFKEKAITYFWNEDMKSIIPADVYDKAEETIQKILSGEIHVPNEYEDVSDYVGP